MGGCLSKKTQKSEKKNKKKKSAGELPAHCSDARRSPPPEEEAVVKEVLLETPKPARAEEQEEVAKQKTKEEEEEINGVRDDRSEDASSEIRSLSESVSVSTTVTERKEGEEEVQTKASRKEGDRSAASLRPQERNRSFSGEFPVRRDQRGGGGRSSPSPVRRSECGISGRSSSGRAAGPAARTRTQAGRGYRRDLGERSGRRSVSPATKGVTDHRGGVSRNTSMRGNGRASPRRATSGSLEGDNKESLDNPLVSLECFIFL